MAKLPSDLDLGRRPEPQVVGKIASYEVPKGATAVGEAITDFGTSLAKQGDALQIQIDREQQRQDKLRAEDATNQLAQATLDLSAGKDGFINKRGADAATQPIMKDYVAKFDDVSRNLTEGLGNDQQKEFFAQRAAHARLQFQGQLLTHVQSERNVFEKQVYAETKDSAAKMVGFDTSDSNMAASMVRVGDAIETERRRLGASPEWAANERAETLDKLWVSRLSGVRVRDPVAALELFQANQDAMTSGVRSKMAESLFADARPVGAAQLASAATARGNMNGPSDDAPPAVFGPPKVMNQAVGRFSPAVATASQTHGVDGNILLAQIQQESGGNVDARGDAGEIGISQFMPGTAARFGVDVKDPVSSINGQARYMAANLKMFGGDYAKALAAYNMGEGNAAKLTGVAGLVSQWGDKWLDHAPRGTQGYVRTILNNVGVSYNGEAVTGAGGAPNVRDLVTDPNDPNANRSRWGKREDGTDKGYGFLGLLKRPDGGVSSEISVGVQINGKEVEIPTMVPTLTRAEVQKLLSIKLDGSADEIPDAIVDKAVAFAKKRIAAGKSPFAGPDESPTVSGPAAPAENPRQHLQQAMLNPTAPTGIGWIDKLPADQRISVLSTAAQMANTDNSDLKATVRDRMQDAATAGLVTGNPGPAAPSRGEVVAAFGAREGDKRYALMQDAIATGQRISGLKSMTDAEIQSALTAAKPTPGDGYADRAMFFDKLLSAANDVRKARNDDPVQFAMSAGGYGIKPIQDFSKPQDLAVELRARASAASKISTDYGTPTAILSKPEASTISKLLRGAPVDQQKQYLGAMAQGVQDINLYKATMQSLAPDDPLLASAGMDMAQGHKAGTGRDVADLVLAGRNIINPPSREDGKNHEGGRSLIKLPPQDQLKTIFDSETNGAFQGTPGARDLFEQRALAIYAKLITDVGDYSGNLDSAYWRSAIQQSTGGIGNYNGKKIVMPWGMPADKFKDGAAVRLAALERDAAGVKPGELLDLPLDNVGDARYLIRRGAGYIVDKNGSPLVVDFNTSAPPVPAGYVPPVPRNPAKFSETRAGAATGMRR